MQRTHLPWTLRSIDITYIGLFGSLGLGLRASGLVLRLWVERLGSRVKGAGLWDVRVWKISGLFRKVPKMRTVYRLVHVFRKITYTYTEGRRFPR